MSLEAMLWALHDAPGVPKHCLGVLMGLAERADEHGRGAYPSTVTLAACARKSKRQAQYDMDELEELGLIRRGDQSLAAHLAADKRPVVFDVAMEAAPGGVQPTAPGGVQPTAPGGVQPTAPRQASDLRKRNRSRISAGQSGVQPTAPNTSFKPEDLKNSLSESSIRTADPAALFDADPEPVAKSPRRAKAAVPATRIPDDFAVTSDMRAWALVSVPGYDFDAETENFIDYWRAKPGTAATKTDWPATWRIWMRRGAREAPQSPRQNSRRNGHQPFKNVPDDDALGFGYDE